MFFLSFSWWAKTFCWQKHPFLVGRKDANMFFPDPQKTNTWNAFCVLVFSATLPLKPATIIALNIGYLAFQVLVFGSVRFLQGGPKNLTSDKLK